jgi:photosystem II stability/assembly factor-like uncharacterized protein
MSFLVGWGFSRGIGAQETPERLSPLTGAGQITPRPGMIAYTPETFVPAGVSLAEFSLVKQFEETTYFLTDLDFTTSSVGWAVGLPHWDQAAHAYRGTILKTEDAGENWQAQNSVTTEVLNAVDFVDTQHGWVVGIDGLYHTADGGANWIQQTFPITDELLNLGFLDANLGWVSSVRAVHWDFSGQPDNWVARLWHTDDGGASWSEQFPPADPSILHAVDFVDAQHGWAVGSKYTGDDPYGRPQHRGVIYATSDGGQNWVEQSYAPEDLNISFTALDFIDAQTGWVAGFPTISTLSGGFVFHTTNGGQTYERQEPGGFFDPLWEIQFIDPQRGYTVGSNYIGAWGPPVWRTLDGGDTWETVRMTQHDNDGLYGLAVTGEQVIALGDRDYQAKSTRAWDSCEWQPPEPSCLDCTCLFGQEYLNIHYRFEDVFFVDESQGWAVGSRSYLPDVTGQVIFYTADGGSTWEPQYQQNPSLELPAFSVFRLDGVYFVDAQRGWAVGMAEYDENYDTRWAILHTEDGGLSWVEQGNELYQNVSPEFFAVQFLDAQTGWALEAGHYDPDLQEGGLFLANTSDGGQNWQWVPTGLPGALGIGFALVQGGLDFVDSQHGWGAGGLGEIIHTSDGGSTWITQTLTCDWPECPLRLFAVDFLDTQQGWIAGEGLFHTVDGGITWLPFDLDLDGDLQDIQFLDAQHGWLAGNRGSVLYTQNGGTSWQAVENLSSGADLLGLSFIDPQTGWLVGAQGTILRTVHTPTWNTYLPMIHQAASPD